MFQAVNIQFLKDCIRKEIFHGVIIDSHTHTHIYNVCVCVERERERETETDIPADRQTDSRQS